VPPAAFAGLQLISVAELGSRTHNRVSKAEKLLARARSNPKDFTWDEACRLMKHHGFTLKNHKGGSSARMFVHSSGQKVRLHEPHPSPIMLRYMIKLLLEGIEAIGGKQE
jgi:ribosomal protein L24E